MLQANPAIKIGREIPSPPLKCFSKPRVKKPERQSAPLDSRGFLRYITAPMKPAIKQNRQKYRADFLLIISPLAFGLFSPASFSSQKKLSSFSGAREGGAPLSRELIPFSQLPLPIKRQMDAVYLTCGWKDQKSWCGTGFLISEKILAMAAHVIDEWGSLSNSYTLNWANALILKKVIAINRYDDLALIEVEAEPIDPDYREDVFRELGVLNPGKEALSTEKKRHRFLEIGDLSEKGDPIYIAGYSKGKLRIIKGEIEKAGKREIYFQIPESLLLQNRGMSGGPVFNGEGKVAGIYLGDCYYFMGELFNFHPFFYSESMARNAEILREPLSETEKREENLSAKEEPGAEGAALPSPIDPFDKTKIEGC